MTLEPFCNYVRVLSSNQKELKINTVSDFDNGAAMSHCKTVASLFERLDMDLEEADKALSSLEGRLSAAMSGINKGLPDHALTNVIAFVRTLDILRMKGQCELAIFKKYHSYATPHFQEALGIIGFVRAGAEVLENEIFFH